MDERLSCLAKKLGESGGAVSAVAHTHRRRSPSTDHPVASIRGGALQSLLFKVEQGLVAAADVAERDDVVSAVVKLVREKDPTCLRPVLRILWHLSKVRRPVSEGGFHASL